MSDSYKIVADGLYFVTFSIVGWLDVFTRRDYQDELCESIIFCQKKQRFKALCILHNAQSCALVGLF